MSRYLKLFLLSIFSVLLIIGCTKKEEEPSFIVDNVVSSDGVKISYEVREKGDPAIVLVHGWSNTRELWDAQISHFSQKHKVVALDLADFGESGNNRSSWTMKSFSEDVIAVVEKLHSSLFRGSGTYAVSREIRSCSGFHQVISP